MSFSIWVYACSLWKIHGNPNAFMHSDRRHGSAHSHLQAKSVSVEMGFWKVSNLRLHIVHKMCNPHKTQNLWCFDIFMVECFPKMSLIFAPGLVILRSFVCSVCQNSWWVHSASWNDQKSSHSGDRKKVRNFLLEGQHLHCQIGFKSQSLPRCMNR